MSQNEINDIRVRFAPSPTGHLHVGGARTALYNWLFARSHGGSFILRIEDTDTARSTEAAVEQIITSMRWLGLDWDEGPEVGGANGPYRQMERTGSYSAALEQLLAEGKAYRCFCTAEKLDKARKLAGIAGKQYVYDGTCRELSAEQAETMVEEGRDFVVRMKNPGEGFTTVHDIVHGDVEFENVLLGDQIIVRSNGVPTYNFAVAVDDSSMGITHVIRGDDHLPNTPRQLLVMEALGTDVPAYAHLPLILGRDKSPLSKRHGSVSVEEFRASGYVREALTNYLALLGWSFDAETTLFSVEELVRKFSLERVGSNAAVFDTDKLLWMNGSYIRSFSESDLTARLEEYINGTIIEGLPGNDGRPTVAQLVPLVQEKMKTLADFITLTVFFFLPLEFEEKALKKLLKDENAAAILTAATDILQGMDDFDLETIERELRARAERMEIKLGRFLQPLRIAVSGKAITPGMFETLQVLGKAESLARIGNAIDMLKGSSAEE